MSSRECCDFRREYILPFEQLCNGFALWKTSVDDELRRLINDAHIVRARVRVGTQSLFQVDFHVITD